MKKKWNVAGHVNQDKLYGRIYNTEPNLYCLFVVYVHLYKSPFSQERHKRKRIGLSTLATE